MLETNLMFLPRTTVEEQGREGTSEESLLVAVLAAALVGYRRYARQRNNQRQPDGVGANWRVMARFEQLKDRL
jgi:hypothetical protein